MAVVYQQNALCSVGWQNICHISEVCVTNKTGFWIWWSNLLNLHTTGYSSSQISVLTHCHLLPTGHSTGTTPLYPFNSLLILLTVPTYNSLARTPRKTVFCCQECVFIGPLPSNGYSIVESVTSGMFLPSRCLAMGMCVTIYSTIGLRQTVPTI
jgi:hypothetical protein